MNGETSTKGGASCQTRACDRNHRPQSVGLIYFAEVQPSARFHALWGKICCWEALNHEHIWRTIVLFQQKQEGRSVLRIEEVVATMTTFDVGGP